MKKALIVHGNLYIGHIDIDRLKSFGGEMEVLGREEIKSRVEGIHPNDIKTVGRDVYYENVRIADGVQFFIYSSGSITVLDSPKVLRSTVVVPVGVERFAMYAAQSGVINPPISVSEPYFALGVGRRTHGWDVGYICHNGHGRTNGLSRYKPVKGTSKQVLTEAQFKEANYGMQIPLASSVNIDEIATKKWEYLPPQTGDTFRLHDFSLYNHMATIFWDFRMDEEFFKNWPYYVDFYLMDVDKATNIHYSLFDNIKNLRFGVGLVNKTRNAYYCQTCTKTLAENDVSAADNTVRIDINGNYNFQSGDVVDVYAFLTSQNAPAGEQSIAGTISGIRLINEQVAKKSLTIKDMKTYSTMVDVVPTEVYGTTLNLKRVTVAASAVNGIGGVVPAGEVRVVENLNGVDSEYSMTTFPTQSFTINRGEYLEFPFDINMTFFLHEGNYSSQEVRVYWTAGSIRLATTQIEVIR